MSLAMCLFGYGLTVAVFAPDLLRRATHRGSAPRMGIAIWVVAVGSVVATWVAAAVLSSAELVVARGDLGRVLGACVAALRAAVGGQHGLWVQAGMTALAAVVAAALVVLAVRVGRALGQLRRHTHRHADAARLVGRSDADLGAVVVDVPASLVYAVAGRPPTIVVSRGVVESLDDGQLHAVLAHERAHLRGRHHLLTAIARGLAAAMPRVRLFAVASAEIARLVELCADDAAARGHGRRVLVDALLRLTASPAPSGALAATGHNVVDRIERLMSPPDRGRVRRARLGLTLGMIGLAAGPALAALLALTRYMCDVALFYY
jgi:Zn-dependent protease with chaperone function